MALETWQMGRYGQTEKETWLVEGEELTEGTVWSSQVLGLQINFLDISNQET